MPKKKSTLAVQKPLPILNFPPEIRVHIWRYTVVKDEDVMVRPRARQEFMKKMVPSRLRSGKELQWHQEDDERRMNSTPLALAHTSRQLYLEAALIYYSENMFNFGDKESSSLTEFVAAIGPQNASSITAARFNTMDASFFQYIDVLPGLKQLAFSTAFFPYRYTCYDCERLAKLYAYTQRHPSVTIQGARKRLIHGDLSWRFQLVDLK